MDVSLIPLLYKPLQSRGSYYGHWGYLNVLGTGFSPNKPEISVECELSACRPNQSDECFGSEIAMYNISTGKCFSVCIHLKK